MPSRLAALALAAALLGAGRADAETVDGGRYGAVEVVAPATPARGVAILFSEGEGLSAKDHARLAALAEAGALAAGVDSAAYLRRLAADGTGCLRLYQDAETLSRDLQRRHPTPQYRVPVVAGEGLGGTLAWRIVGQAPLQTVGGALSLDPAPGLPLARDICPRPLEADDREGSGTAEAPVLKNPWIAALTPAAASTVRARLAQLQPAAKRLSVLDLAHAPDAPGFADLVRPLLAPNQATDVAGLSLVEMPASPRTRRMAVFLSGDGGWRDVDKRVSEKLQQLGVSVVGWSSLEYFWRRKTPEQTAADLAAIIEAYQRKWGCDEVALIGFSFGADVMPFIYPRLDAGLRRRIALIALMSPGPAADWEIQVTGWLGAGPSSAAAPLAAVAADLPGPSVQCFYGDRDSGNSCALFAARGAETIEKPGDHHMDGDYDAIGRQIFEGFARRTAP